MTRLVTLHGFTGNREAWAQVAPSSALALSGHAMDVPVPDVHSFAAEANRLTALIASDGQPVHLAGYSLGARLALAIACKQPANISALTVVGAHPGLLDEAQRKHRRDADERWCRLLEDRGIDAFEQAWSRLPMWHSQSRLDSEILDQQRRIRCSHNPNQLAAALRTLGLGSMAPLWDQLETLPMPVQVIAGARDSKFSAIAADMVKRIGRGQLHLIDGAGHNPILERPAQVRAVLFQKQAQTRRAQ